MWPKSYNKHGQGKTHQATVPQARVSLSDPTSKPSPRMHTHVLWRPPAEAGTSPPRLRVHMLALRPLANIVPGGEAPGRADTPPSSPEPDLHPATSQQGPQESPPTHVRPGKGQLLQVSQQLAAVTATGAV